MVRLIVDGLELPLCGSLTIPGYDARKLHSVQEWRRGEEVVVDVASTPESDKLLGYAFDLQRNSGFNDVLHRAVVEADGVVVFEGKATLLSTSESGTKRTYRLSIRSGGSLWADKAATTQLADSSVEASMSITPYDVEQSWHGDKAVRFLPLQHDTYPEPHDSGLWGAQRVLLPTDYHPFLSVRHILRSIAQESGYRIQSSWLESDIASRLMMSGAYATLRGEAAERAMGFKAYRTQTTTARANGDGCVFVCKPVSENNLGAIIDSVDPTATDDNGDAFADAYANGGALQFVNSSPIFTPKRELSVAYEYRVRYRTDYRITSTKYLTGFDRLYLGLGCDVELKLENPFQDQSQSLEPNILYKLFIFDYNPTTEYKLLDIGPVSGQIFEFQTTDATPRRTRLYAKVEGASYFTAFTGEWAIYNGYVEERGSRDVEFVVRTPYVSYTASDKERFNSLMFYGAEPGQSITLYSGCSVKALFSGAVGYGSEVEFGDVARHDITQQRLIEAIGQMFNLCIYTHEPSKSIFIEPYDAFFSGDVVDWRDRQLRGEWSIVEGAPQSFECVRLGYAGSDGVVSRENDISDKEFGLWERRYDGYGAKQGVDSRKNPLFLPTLSLTGFVGSTPSAEVLTVGDRDDITGSDYVEPRVVLYNGMRRLPEGEHWIAHSSGISYPHGSFHSPESEYTLCFEDRDGLVGLHRYYDRELDEIALRGELRCKIYLPVVEYVTLFDPHNDNCSIRSRFRLEVEGVSALYTLRAIEEYDPKRCVATALFRRTLSDE